jgi:hypothetical protein
LSALARRGGGQGRQDCSYRTAAGELNFMPFLFAGGKIANRHKHYVDLEVSVIQPSGFLVVLFK